jgi:hypothetical protein
MSQGSKSRADKLGHCHPDKGMEGADMVTKRPLNRSCGHLGAKCRSLPVRYLLFRHAEFGQVKPLYVIGGRSSAKSFFAFLFCFVFVLFFEKKSLARNAASFADTMRDLAPNRSHRMHGPNVSTYEMYKVAQAYTVAYVRIVV